MLVHGFQKGENTAGFLEAARGTWLTASIRPFTVGDFNINASNTSSVSFLTYKSTGKERQESHVTEGPHNSAAAPGDRFLSYRCCTLAPPAKPQTPDPDNIQQGDVASDSSFKGKEEGSFKGKEEASAEAPWPSRENVHRGDFTMLARLVSNSWPQVIRLPGPPKVLGLRVWLESVKGAPFHVDGHGRGTRQGSSTIPLQGLLTANRRGGQGIMYGTDMLGKTWTQPGFVSYPLGEAEYWTKLLFHGPEHPFNKNTAARKDKQKSLSPKQSLSEAAHISLALGHGPNVCFPLWNMDPLRIEAVGKEIPGIHAVSKSHQPLPTS
ncbi:hypothetical protein AAY473_031464 [Plecturocebus cupreus]